MMITILINKIQALQHMKDFVDHKRDYIEI